MFGNKEIFEYEIEGHGKFFADPLSIRRGLLKISDGHLWAWAIAIRQLEKMIGEIKDEDEGSTAKRAEYTTRQADIEGQMAEAAFAAFGLVPLDATTGHGITESTALTVLQKFLAWLEEKKNRPAG